MQLIFELLTVSNELRHLDEKIYVNVVSYELTRYLTKNYAIDFEEQITYTPSPFSLTSLFDVDVRRFSTFLLGWSRGNYRTTLRYIGNGAFMLNGTFDKVFIENSNFLRTYDTQSCLNLTQFYQVENNVKTQVHRRMIKFFNYNIALDDEVFYRDTVFLFIRLIECQYPDITTMLFNSPYHFSQTEILDEVLSYYNAVIADIRIWGYRYGSIQQIKTIEVDLNAISLHR